MRTVRYLIVLLMLSMSTYLLVKTSAYGSVGAATAADGVALFDNNCSMCHGKDGTGRPNWKAKGQPDLTSADWQKSHSDGQISETIKNGKGRYMPSFKAKLSDEEISSLVGRIRAFAKKK